MTSLRGRQSYVVVRFVIPGLLLVAGAVPAGGAVLRVDAGARGAGTGASWPDAFTDLRDAMDAANAGDAIWVVTGVYRPDRGTMDRAASFNMKSGVAIYGGFTGVETQRTQRDIRRNPTVLSGDLEGNDVPLDRPEDRFLDPNRQATHRDDNSFNVVRAIGVDASAVLDGFTVRGGQAAERYVARTIVGGAMFIADGNPTIRNCAFVDNGAVQSGGAVATEDASPTFADCVFERNAANRQGGAVEVRGGSPQFERCVFQGNVARWGGAGVYLVNAQQSEFIDCRFEDNVARLGGGGLQSEADRDDGRLTLGGCTFIDNVAGRSGGGLSVSRGRVTITDCSLLANAAGHEGGGLIASNADVTMTDSAIRGNVTETGRGSEFACDAHATIRMQGDGVISPGLIGTVQIDGTFVVADRVRITSGDFVVGQRGAMILRDEAQVELRDDGTIVASGTLQATDHSVLAFTTISVRRVTLDGDAIVSNNVITAEAGAPFGQFLVDGNANVVENEIRSGGDHYLDVDVRGFGGFLDANRVFVRITEGIGTARGPLFEVRGEDRFPMCRPDSFVCGLGPDQIPAFDGSTWTLEVLELARGAKLNLTNRFDFGNGGSGEVLYVKRLIIGEGAVLNTGFNRLYYGTLEGSGDIVNDPLLGFPLGVIQFDDENEFISRIAPNNDDGINGDGTIGQSRIHVRRVVGQLPDPTGMMQLETRPDKRTGAVVHARAKGHFGRKGDDADTIWIWFRYRFDAPGGTLIVSLSEDPDVGEGNLEIARRAHPPAGEPGSLGSSEFAVFRALVPVGDRAFRRGVQIELELAGSEGVRALIDDFDPFECSTDQCGDITGDRLANFLDLNAALSEIGKPVSFGGGAVDLQCVDHPLPQDGYSDLWNVVAYAATSGLDVPCQWRLTGNTSQPYSPATAGIAPAEADEERPLPMPNALLVAGLGAGPEIEGPDQIHALDLGGASIRGPMAPNSLSRRGNGALVLHPSGAVLQLSFFAGLVGWDGMPVVPPGVAQGVLVPGVGSADIQVGVYSDALGLFGVPMSSAAFDPNGDVIVGPIVVKPHDPAVEPYKAVVKLRLDPAADPPYDVVTVYGSPPANAMGTTVDRQGIREVAVDGEGRVYVTTATAWNRNDWLLRFHSDGSVASTVNLTDLGIQAPVGLMVARGTRRVCLASSLNEERVNNVTLFRFDLDDLHARPVATVVHSMEFVAGVAEDPATGRIWAVGFVTQSVRDLDDLPYRTAPITTPCLAEIGVSGVRVVDISASGLALPLSILFVPEVNPNPPAKDPDFDGDGDVDLADFIALLPCFGDPGVPSDAGCATFDFDRDGDVDLGDFMTFVAAFTEPK